MVKYKNLNINITSSDAENVNIVFESSNKVILTFIDYAKKNVKVNFNDVKAFCYKRIVHNGEHQTDQIFEDVKSEWIQKELKDYFLIYEPRDIISGDFYWFDITEDHYLLALADCTGHGVPGALLSMIGYMMLNENVKVRHILDPAKIIARLHQGFRYILQQQIEETDTYDGMDMGLCRVDLHTGKSLMPGPAARFFMYKTRNSLR